MRKTILALAILSSISFQANAQLSGDDLMDITDILNDTPTATAKTSEKAKPVETKKTESVKVEKKTSTTVTPTNTKKTATVPVPAGEVVKGVDVQPVEKSKTTPTLVVPVSATNFVLNVRRLNKSIITKTLSKDEIALGMMTGVADEHKADKEVIAFVEDANKNKVVSFSNYVEEPNVYVGTQQIVTDGKVEFKEKLETLVYGYGYIVQIKDYDKKNNRVSIRLDYTNKEISSYQESEITTTEGILTKVKVPTIKTSVTSNVFWIKLDQDSKQSIKVNDKHYLDIVMGRVLPYVQPVIAIDYKKMAADEKAAKEAAIKAEQDKIKAAAAAKEADKINAAKAENNLYDDLESDLKKK